MLGYEIGVVVACIHSKLPLKLPRPSHLPNPVLIAPTRIHAQRLSACVSDVLFLHSSSVLRCARLSSHISPSLRPSVFCHPSVLAARSVLVCNIFRIYGIYLYAFLGLPAIPVMYAFFRLHLFTRQDDKETILYDSPVYTFLKISEVRSWDVV